ncbi:unnamed protein product (macronuclear) [Paramecium tetraurelia]|uniref:LITAF domain-containing protein n=1 Tax=Paramecium tetraurelia TaxID=5888 RepID=A0DEF5_PARTE|nr:uncharacterized protein GSPATT00016248001 [Paramecium tetraurelia]CAK81422.1 unnamed protein product [Paramecium tetraurelia]|eukprot:XP_001448819.1 hypothetical protein (macronuclear) [Paramecium tetraurelia strain d4-2]
MSAHSFKQSQAQINHQPPLKPFCYIPDSPTAKPEQNGEQDFIKLSINKQSSTKSDVDNSANSNLITNEKNNLPLALHNKFPMVSNFTINHNEEKYEYEKPIKTQQPTKIYCKFCNTRKPTQIQLKNGSNTYILACILFVLCLPLFWVPLISKKCKDQVEICVVCNRQTSSTPFRLF